MAEPSDATAMRWLDNMFEVEMRFMRSGSGDLAELARAFHTDVVVHEPATLPYAGDWRGLDGIAALMRRMGEVWSDMRVDGMAAARRGDTVYLSSTLHLTARATGATLTQPFAEVLRFEDGLLVEGTPFYFDTAEILAALERRGGWGGEGSAI